MPWIETKTMDQRQAFIRDWLRHGNVSGLSRSYGISRVTAHKWIARFHEGGHAALEDQSRRPHSCPHATSSALQAEIVALRKRHPTWGPKKLASLLERRGRVVPAASTIGDILHRAGLVTPRASRRRYPPSDPPGGRGSEPNEVWCIDYKGEFRLGNGRLCYPLTVSDEFSRFIIGCQGFPTIRGRDVYECLWRYFEDHGLPRRIRSDNGVPFANTGVCGLSRLSVWWLRLGISLDRNQPRHPEQNGCHERMHRSLKAAVCRPPAQTMAGQQRRFDRFRAEYNDIRPHESLGMATPSESYRPSPRAMPKTLPEISYPGHYEVRKVDSAGMMRLHGDAIFVSNALAGQHVGLVEVDDRLWAISFMSLSLGQYDARRRQFYPAALRNARSV